ncbi:UNVERIFIED_CONTAM: hypothetical protein HDU68_004139 [Siphonaria sp. JEL0065]|nr:hypothetical protein HDU68_004139 [Siphonaria sp. JEL0065]
MRAVHINFHSRSNNTPTIALLTPNQTITTKTGQDFQTLHAQLLTHSALLHARLPLFLCPPTLFSKIKNFLFRPACSLCIKQTNEYIDEVLDVRDENLVVFGIVTAFIGGVLEHYPNNPSAASSPPPLTQSSTSSSNFTRINSPVTLSPTTPSSPQRSESVANYMNIKKHERDPRQASRNQQGYSIYPVLGIWKEEAAVEESTVYGIMEQDASEEGGMEDLSYSDFEIESGDEEVGQEGVDEVVGLYECFGEGKLN